jgi:hypothetical protein
MYLDQAEEKVGEGMAFAAAPPEFVADIVPRPLVLVHVQIVMTRKVLVSATTMMTILEIGIGKRITRSTRRTKNGGHFEDGSLA